MDACADTASTMSPSAASESTGARYNSASDFADPLSEVDVECDLDEVLRIGRINAVRGLMCLCPNLPGESCRAFDDAGVLFLSKSISSEDCFFLVQLDCRTHMFVSYAGIPRKQRKQRESRVSLSERERRQLSLEINRTNVRLTRERQKM